MKRILAAVLAASIALPAAATRIRRMSLDEMRQAAVSVLIVDVIGSSTRLGDANMVWTDYRARIADVLRGPGAAGEEITLPFAGGRFGGFDAGIAGVPRLDIGSRYLIFLDDAPGRPVPAIGWSDGIFHMRADRVISLTEEQQLDGHSGSCTCGGPAVVPVQWEIEHADPAYVAAAKEVFDRWNACIDVFDARAGDGVIGPNGKNEVAFLDIATTSAKYGINMDRNTFAITYMTPLSAAGDFDACPKPPDAICGTFEETDVIVNSDFSRGFKASGPVDFSDRGPALYAATVAHELGHSLGFHHNVDNISVMDLYEDFAAQYIAAADTKEARAAYPSRVQRITDLALYPFYFDPLLTDYAATTPVEISPTSVVPGSTITVRNFGFENVGTESVRDVLIRFSLGSYEIGSVAFSGPLVAGAYWDDRRAGLPLTIPRDLPLGTYELTATISQVDGTSDAITYNNSWVAPQQIHVVSGNKRRSAAH